MTSRTCCSIIFPGREGRVTILPILSFLKTRDISFPLLLRYPSCYPWSFKYGDWLSNNTCQLLQHSQVQPIAACGFWGVQICLNHLSLSQPSMTKAMPAFLQTFSLTFRVCDSPGSVLVVKAEAKTSSHHGTDPIQKWACIFLTLPSDTQVAKEALHILYLPCQI